jgi:hypothetical protein
MKRRLHLVTFASAAFESSRDRLLASARRSGQFREVVVWDDERLRSDPFVGESSLLAHSRGIGYWFWKPHIICDTLERVAEGDVVVYSDAGRFEDRYAIDRSVAPLIQFAEQHEGLFPGVLVSNFGPNAWWTRRDCFVLMGCDDVRFWEHPQVQATFSLWIKCERALSFVREWRTYCSDIRVVGDGPNTCGLANLPGFIDHRHDQSVLTNLVVKLAATPFVIESHVINWIASRRPRSRALNLVSKKIDNVSAIASGTPASLLLLREGFNSRFGSFAGAFSMRQSRRP